MKELQKLASFQVYESTSIAAGLPIMRPHSMTPPTSFIMVECQPGMVAQALDMPPSFCMP
jgi:hypothetical protein